jgi:hypothetical protein
MASALTHPPRCAETPRSTGKAAASEEVKRTLRYGEPLSDARTPLAEVFSILLGRIAWNDFIKRHDCRLITTHSDDQGFFAFDLEFPVRLPQRFCRLE